MNNNLNIENLIKTEWFNQFNEEQQEEIIKGLEDNVNVFIYAKPDFNCFQMEQIRLGLKDNLDVSIYAKKEYPAVKMEEIRIKMRK